SPRRALSVEWKEETLEPSIHSQFQPPSSCWCWRSQSTSPSTSASSQSPFDRAHELMQTSTSPPQYVRFSYSQRTSASFSAVPASAAASTPHSRRSLSAQVVAVHGCGVSSAKAKSAGKLAPPAHAPSS